MGKKGQYVWTDEQDACHLSRGVYVPDLQFSML